MIQARLSYFSGTLSNQRQASFQTLFLLVS